MEGMCELESNESLSSQYGCYFFPESLFKDNIPLSTFISLTEISYY